MSERHGILPKRLRTKKGNKQKTDYEKPIRWFKVKKQKDNRNEKDYEDD